MVKMIELLLLSILGAIILPSIQANEFGAGTLGKLQHGKLMDEGAVGGLLMGATDAINSGLCRTLGPGFLPLLYTNNRCPKRYFKPDTFKSFEKLCECYKSNSQLQRCLSLSVISIGLHIPGVSDIAVHLGKCCKINEPSHEFELLGQIGDGFGAIDIPRNPDALINELGYKFTDGTSDLLCSVVGPNFLQVLLTDSNCPNGVLLPSTFKSLESFCYRFRNEWSPDIQNCMTTSAVRLLIKLKGITNFNPSFGDCCARCPGIRANNPPPSCTPPKVPPVSVPTYGC